VLCFDNLGTALKIVFVFVSEIRSRLNLESVSYHSVQNLSSSRLLAKNIKIKIYRTISFPIVLYGYEIWPRTLSEGQSSAEDILAWLRGNM
jgi:hypothetical protein